MKDSRFARMEIALNDDDTARKRMLSHFTLFQMALVQNKLIGTVRWRTLNRGGLACDEESARYIQNSNAACWHSGSIVPNAGANNNINGDPTISEYLTVNQFHAPTFGHLEQRYGANSRSICGACSVAAALVMSRVISENKWWSSTLDPGKIGAILNELCDPTNVIPLIENVVHFMSVKRIEYMRSAECDKGLKTSAAQQKKFLAEQAANFELSDCVRAILELGANNNNNRAAPAVVLIPESNTSPLGPTPHIGALPLNLGASVPASGLVHVRANLWPIVNQARHLQRKRIELEERQFGGKQTAQKDVQHYATGECAFFVDVLCSDAVMTRYQQQQQQQQPPTAAAALMKDDGNGASKAAMQQEKKMHQQHQPAGKKSQPVEVINLVDSDDDNTNNPAAATNVNNPREPSLDAAQQLEMRRKTAEQEEEAARSAAAAAAALPEQKKQLEEEQEAAAATKLQQQTQQQQQQQQPQKVPLPKFLTPIAFCRAMRDKTSHLHPASVGPRVHIVDVLGHFVAMLCYVDGAGTAHGVIINSSESRELTAMQRPTVRFAFELYVANVAGAMQ